VATVCSRNETVGQRGTEEGIVVRDRQHNGARIAFEPTAATLHSRLRTPIQGWFVRTQYVGCAPRVRGRTTGSGEWWREAQGIADSLACRQASKNCSRVAAVNSRGSDQELSGCRIGWYLRCPSRNQAAFPLSAQRFC